MAIGVTIAGITYTSFMNPRSLKIQDNLVAHGDTANFDLALEIGQQIVPKSGNEVIILDGSDRIFAGIVVSIEHEFINTLWLRYRFSCIDYTYLLDRRFVNKLYSSAAVDDTMKEILDDLQIAANNDQAGGDVHYDDFQSDKTLISLGPVIPQQRFERILPSQAFDVLAESGGMRWFIDYNKVVNFVFLETNLAPLEIPAEGNPAALPTINVDTDVLTYRDLKLEESIQNIGTKVILRDAIVKSTDQIEDTFTFVTGASQKFQLSRRPFSELDVTVKLNAVTQTILLDDVNADATDETSVSGSVYLYVGPRERTHGSYVRFPTGDTITNGHIILVTYNYDVSEDHENPSITGREDIAERTGGDGIHEFVFSQISGLAVTDTETLDVISDVILAAKAAVLRTGTFISYAKGSDFTPAKTNWRAGQIFRLVWSSQNIDQQYYVISVRRTVDIPNDDPNTGQNQIRHQIEFSSIPRGGFI